MKYRLFHWICFLSILRYVWLSLKINFVPLLENECFQSAKQCKSFIHRWFLLWLKEKAHSCNTITWNNCKIYLVLYNLVIGNAFIWELQTKSERENRFKVWSSYTPTSFSQYAKKTSVPSLHDMDVAEYSENGFKCNFFGCAAMIRSFSGSYMIFPDPFSLLECSVPSPCFPY